MRNVLEVNNLVKSYGRQSVLSGASFTVKPGRIVGLMGPNGSGKTTMLNIIAGLSRFKSGEITVDGRPLGFHSRSSISYMPDENFLYEEMKVGDAVSYYKDFFPDFNQEKNEKLLNFMGLDSKQKVDKLSKGNVEKLLIALTLSRDTNLYLLDEPLGATDPVIKSQIIDSILENFTRENSALLISTHLIKDVEKLLDDIMFLKEGRITLSGDCDDLRKEYGKTIEEIYISTFS